MSQTVASRHLMTRPEAGEYLRLSHKTLARWAWLGKGPVFIKAGGKVLYDVADLNAWLDGQRRRSTSDPGDAETVGEAA